MNYIKELIKIAWKCGMETYKIDKNWEKELDKTFITKNTDGVGRPFTFGELYPEARENIKSFIRTLLLQAEQKGKEEEQERIMEEIKKIKERFKCAACNGAKCEHTQGCQIINNVLRLIQGDEK